MALFSILTSIFFTQHCFFLSIESAVIPNELTHIDLLRISYLNSEKTLWNVIKSGADNSFVLKSINDVHIKLFAEPLYEKEVHFTTFDADQRQIKLEIEVVNHRISNMKKNYLRMNPNGLNLTALFAEQGVEKMSSMEKIFNATEQSDFFSYLKNKGDLQSCMVATTRIDSTSQLIYEYYYDISAVLLKSYALLQLTYMLLTVYGSNNYVMESQNVHFRFRENTSKMQDRVRELMSDAKANVWMCDPDVYYKLDHTDNQITRFVQGYIDNEANLNEQNSCKKTCSDYAITRNYLCFNGSYCSYESGEEQNRHRCMGTVLNCLFIHSNVQICPAEDGSSRRYTYLKFDLGRSLGSDTCTTIARRAISWNRWFVHCSNCFCYCDEQGRKSDRYFSLHPVLSDTAQNKIISGVAIQKINRIFHWRITQNVLMGNGNVYDTRNVYTKFREDIFFNIDDVNVQSNVDYHTLTWQNRSVNLVSVIAPQGTVLTGIRFLVMHGRLSLAIRATRFDFSTGILKDVDHSEWITNLSANRTQIILEDPDVPNKSPSKSIPNFKKNQYIDFQPSSMNKDAGQTTVPFIDDQVVEPRKPTLLSGIGLYYKGEPGFGGYIAPQIFTYDMGPYITSTEVGENL